MAKREWGAKHTCMSCGVKFYDLHRNPIACPKCETEVEVEAARPNRRRPAAQPEPAPAPAATEQAVIAVDAADTDDAAADEIIDDIEDDGDLVEDIDAKESKHPDS
ncbi:MAG: TIGR02300 family protein [Rhodospirillales bacterium]|nr:TIGR02300 family protein [Rhodospirillales bacterium]